MHILIGWILWFGLAALVILVDRKLVAAAPAGDALAMDVTDRSVSQYLMLQVLFGGLVIPFYLWNSRKTAGAAVLGVVLMLVCSTIVGYTVASLAPRPY